jgi:hypothetical protein
MATANEIWMWAGGEAGFVEQVKPRQVPVAPRPV